MVEAPDERTAGDVAGVRGRVAGAIRVCLRPDHLRRTIRIALIVGVILTLINQADVIIRGDAVSTTWIKVGANFVVPFIVSNLGLLAGKKAERGG